jgi:zinc transport system ATP-binding protein
MSDAVKKTPVVELQNVGVQYPSGVTALEGITLEVFEKDLIGLIGPNGSGKSTLLKVILGLIKPNVGTVKLFGEPISEKNLKKVGFVPQRTQVEDANFPSTVYETVLLGRIPKVGLFRRYGRKDYEKVEELLNLIGIHDLRDRKIGQLSGGQSQRVFLAKALVGEPKLLILDEPTSGVDVDSKREFYNIIGKLDREQGTTIILASHEIGIVTKLATRIVCINKSQFYCGEITDVEASSLLSNWLKGGLLHDHP